ncbi:MAG TPA: mechanosensitive ion channel domain-containing protein [Usitatibacter sp.]|nr:mechanosensitive ion channel domain-containing protein [Usitatibacter sp.]
MAFDFDVSPLKRFLEGVAGDPTPAIVLWQVGVAITALVLGYLLAVLVCRRIRPSPRWKFGEGDFQRVAFPLLTLMLLAIGKGILGRYQRVALLEIVQALLVAWVVIRLAVYVLGLVLPHGGFLRGVIRAIAWVAWIAVALHLTGLLAGTIATLDEVGLTVGKDQQRITLWLVMQGIAALALTLTLAAWISRISESRVMATEHLEMSTRVVISKIVHAGTIFLAILVALPLVGIPLTALSIFSGALGVGLGFGLQKIASNYVSGFIVLLDKSLRLGDVITVDNRKGEVKAIESRYTVIRGGDGVESIIPNEKLITESVNHHTYSDPKVSMVLGAVITFDVDVDHACKLLREAALRHEGVLAEPRALARVKGLRDHGIELELTAWIEIGVASEADLKSEIYKDVLRAFRTAGIEISDPRRQVVAIATPATPDKDAKSTT